MSDSRIILTDLDETVLCFSGAFERWMTGKGYQASGCFRDQYSISRTFGLNDQLAQRLLVEFHRSEAYGEMEAEPCAAQVIPALAAQGWSFVGITAVPADPEVARRRHANLERCFGFRWLAVHVVGLGADKTATLGAYHPTIWVEDHLANASIGATLGHRSFLLDRVYNRQNDIAPIIRVSDWHEIARSITVGCGIFPENS